MEKRTSSPPKIETHEDRFQHDIEELEGGSGFKGFLRGLVIIVLAVGVVVVMYFSAGKKPPAPRMSAKGTVMIDILEPAKGRLSLPPTHFKWESIAGRNDYMFRLLQKGNPKPLVERSVRDNSTDLSADEASRLVQGSGYIWEVEARTKDGKTLGSGRGFFDL